MKILLALAVTLWIPVLAILVKVFGEGWKWYETIGLAFFSGVVVFGLGAMFRDLWIWALS